MKIRNSAVLLRSIALAAALFFCRAADGAISLSITDSTGLANEVAVNPGNAFTINVRVDATVERVLGVTYNVVAPDSSSGGGFSILDRVTVGTLFSDLTTPAVDGVSLPDPNAAGGGGSFVDLGGLADDYLNPGSHFLATLTISTNGLLPGVYTLSAGAGSVATYDGEDPITLVSIGSNSYFVRIIPEPDAAILSIGGLGMLTILRRRH